MLADGVLHLARLGLGVALRVLLHVGDEVVGQKLDGRDLGVDAEIDEVLVDQRLHLLAGVGDVERVVLVALLHHAQQVAEAPRRPAIGVTGRVGQDQVQALQELLQVDLEVRPPLDVLHRADGRVDDGDFGLGRAKRALHEGLDVGDAAARKCCRRR